MKGDRVPRANRKSIVPRQITDAEHGKKVEDWYSLHSEVATFQPIVSVAWASYKAVRLSELYPSSATIIRNTSSLCVFKRTTLRRDTNALGVCGLTKDLNLVQVAAEDVNGSLVMDEVSKAVAQESLEMTKEEKRALDFAWLVAKVEAEVGRCRGETEIAMERARAWTMAEKRVSLERKPG